MTLRIQAAFAGLILMALCGAVQAKPVGCGCEHRAKSAHAVVHRAATHATRQRSHMRRVYAARHSQYDYYHARRLSEDVYHAHRHWGARRDERYGSRDRENKYSYDSNGHGDYRARADGPPISLNGRDFSGGVGYGQNGDTGYYQGGYGRFDPYNGNTAGMNGGAANDRARMSVWHGYNSHNGLGNGY